MTITCFSIRTKWHFKAQVVAGKAVPLGGDSYHVIDLDPSRHVASHMVLITQPADARYAPLTAAQVRTRALACDGACSCIGGGRGGSRLRCVAFLYSKHLQPSYG